MGDLDQEMYCEACGWEGEKKELLPDTTGGFVHGDCNEHVSCPCCGTEGWLKETNG